jgi:hypothetical protein
VEVVYEDLNVTWTASRNDLDDAAVLYVTMPASPWNGPLSSDAVM